jgi:hypothetical protein
MKKQNDVFGLVMHLWERLQEAESKNDDSEVLELTLKQNITLQEQVDDLTHSNQDLRAEIEELEASRGHAAPTEEYRKLEHEFGLLRAKYQQACADRDTWAQKHDDLAFEQSKIKKPKSKKTDASKGGVQ